jgi:hypothetical protein
MLPHRPDRVVLIPGTPVHAVADPVIERRFACTIVVGFWVINMRRTNLVRAWICSPNMSLGWGIIADATQCLNALCGLC